MNDAAAPTVPFTSHAQNFEDVMLWRALRDVPSGRYLDIGAGEPDADSVTLAFYERGWHGVNVEPLPGPFARVQAARPRDVNLNLAVGAARGEARLFVVGNETGLSTVDPVLAEQHRAGGWELRQTRVPLTTLAEICATHVDADLHFLKIDAEGAELSILQGADFARCRPWIMLLETPDAARGHLPRHEEWEAAVLTPASYEFVWFDGLNRFYVASEHRQRLAGAFRTPPNVFDNFVRNAEIMLRQQCDAEQASAQAAHALAHAAQERADEAHSRVHAAQTLVTEAQSRLAATEAQIAEAQATRAAAEDHARAAEAERDHTTAEMQARIRTLDDALARAMLERDGWAQELFESNRYAADLTVTRQNLLQEQARLHRHEAWRMAQVAAYEDGETQLRQHVAALEAEQRKAQADAAGSASLAAETALWLDAVRQSLSWRVTKPVRVLGRLLGRRSRG